ncbi:Hypothetical predicted protein [Mytilus galloprovincialis]|uniref:Uncharacterized protein n=1 Tax=Mytilus galloprovincialis TaxID=29158 RepID=A0A8B6G339_MYTGA|nr:Hypothetical predicted protein [Mytilus galloprovincialis]
MQVLVVLLLVFVVVEAHYYDRGRTPRCKFPCPWRGKTFDFWEIGKSKSEIYGKFSKDGRRIKWSFGRTDECYQILDGFIVFRLKGEDNWFCVKIQYDRTKSPTTFRLHNGLVGDFPGKKDAFKICEVCAYPGTNFFTAVERGSHSYRYAYRRPPKQSRKFGCIIPKGCKCCKLPQCGRCRRCRDNGSIPNACS